MSEPIGQSEKHIEFAKILGQQTDFQEILRLVAHQSSSVLKADLALILMLNPDSRDTVRTLFKDGRYQDNKEFRPIHINVGGWIIKHRQSFISADLPKDKRFSTNLFKSIPVKSVLGTPLIIEGIVIGALILLYQKDKITHDKESITILEDIAVISVPFLRNIQKIKQYFTTSLPSSTLLSRYKSMGLLGKSQKFVELLHAIEAAAHCDVKVLLEGKTGTGKELIARAIHRFSSRCDASFVTIDCGAISQTLIESELFGHKKGSFTGADYDRTGLIMEAQNGTLFMDEISNLPFELQSKLLRVLEEGEVRPIGSNKSYQVDVRIIAASSSSLKNMVETKQFREDLYFRLNIYPIHIPDLEERQSDIPLLARHFLKLYARQQKKELTVIHEEILDFLKKRPWPGNIRELENLIERLVTVAPQELGIIDETCFTGDLKAELHEYRQLHGMAAMRKSLKSEVQHFEASMIRRTLEECRWNQSEAARRLQTSEKNIRNKIQQYQIKKSKPSE
jgi:transcriptional regulator with GAF, ATPase, and Fis domain